MTKPTRPDPSLGLPAALEAHGWAPPCNFLGVEAAAAAWAGARAAVLPVPYESTTSWGTGTREGPRAILEASRYVEWYDEELDEEPVASGICTLPAVELTRGDPGEALRELRRLYDALLEAAGDRLVVALGGEHALSWAPATAWAERLDGPLSVLQFDAHADLRDSYQGTRWNHACVMRRILEDAPDVRIVSVGVRGLTAEEMETIRAHGITAAFARQLREPGWQERVLDGLGDDVYLTFDVDFFDPALMPATGTPEPGGGDWWQATDLLRTVCRERRVVGADVVELAPGLGPASASFVAAKLVYKLIGYWLAGA